MTQKNILTQNIDSAALTKRMLLGAGMGLIVILSFVLQVRHPHVEWGKFWMVRPLLVVPFAGAVGGAFHYYVNLLTGNGGWKKVLANVISFVVFVIGLWMGIVLGLVGTLWH
ncbi:potassium transporter KefB [Mucilaginibacter terrigena]|uniref:Potassium transporter KefB n=1 Tax=Mucilaginibacter terrigena TaxID=2492395 RepID=A0A4Q5LSJ4_9SPHI|nr:potassium transporter KefB [Mucilaginibacter terrigena]RYU92492.1 potassium transporter KefB [Mucilaginibacter terrigena]